MELRDIERWMEKERKEFFNDSTIEEYRGGMHVLEDLERFIKEELKCET